MDIDEFLDSVISAGERHEEYLNNTIISCVVEKDGERYFRSDLILASLSGLLLKTVEALYNARANTLDDPTQMQPADLQEVDELINGLTNHCFNSAMKGILDGDMVAHAQIDVDGTISDAHSYA